MASLDMDKLLQEVSAESPCGDDLEYDPEFQQLELAIQYKPEQRIGDSVVEAQEPDWREARKLATALLSRTKDLRVAVYLTRAQLHTAGFTGFSEGLGLLKGLLENYWDEVHPQLDPDDNNDPTFRVNTVGALCDGETVLKSVKNTPLVKAAGIGRFSIRDVDIAKGLLTPVAEEDRENASSAVIEAAFMEVDLDELQSAAQAVTSAIESVAAIESIFTEKVSASQAPNLSELSKLLQHISTELNEHLSRRGVSEEQAQEQSETGETAMASQPATAISGDVRSREDVIRMLDKICDYYKQHEPSSPLPLLLQRAKRLVRKDFMEILKDIAPEGVKQAELIGGGEE